MVTIPNEMEILVLNTDFEAVTILDSFKSLLWTDRYNSVGDFEIYTPMLVDLLSVLQVDYYLWFRGSEHVMIIEDRQIDCDIDDGNYFIVTGRSLESILERRIIWDQIRLTGNFQDGIHTLINNAIISPTISDRTISNFIFEASTDTMVTSLTIDTLIERGTNLYDIIQSLCIEKNIGFKITLSSTNQFVFKLYAGVDRSYEQTANPYVVFSPSFDNLINSNYVETKRNFKTVALVEGEGEGTDRKTTIVGEGSSLSRREIYTDATNISKTVNDVVLTDAQYLALLTQKGSEDLSSRVFETGFDSQSDTFAMFKYGEDFFLGDLVQVVNEYGIESQTRVVEIIISQSASGIEVCPTFSKPQTNSFSSSGVLTSGDGSSYGKPILVGNVGIFSNVLGFYFPTYPITGALVISVGVYGRMITADIKLRSYNYLANITVGGYVYPSGNTWDLPQAVGLIRGGNLNVRFVTRNSDNVKCVIIGDITTSWYAYLHGAVTNVCVGYPGGIIKLETWAASIVTDISGYTVNFTQLLAAQT